jgi:putative ABC transport system permease protein
MKMLLTLAWRNIWRNKRRSFISMASVLFAVFFAVSADSFERGSHEQKIESLVKFSTGYIQIQDVLYEEEPSIDNSMVYDEQLMYILEEFDNQISYVVPRIQNFALAATEHNTRGTMIMGIVPKLENKINQLENNLIKGSYLAKNDNAVMIAQGLADILDLDVGDTLVLIGQGFHGMSASGLYPVKGIVRLAIPEMNNNMVYMPLETAQWFFGTEDRVSSLIIMPERPARTRTLANQINQKVDTEWYSVLTWEQMLSDALRLMEVDMAGTRIIIYILYIVIGFGLFATILTMMLERLKEFGMLISLGMKRSQLAIICLLETIFMSLMGALAGIMVSLPIILYYHFYPITLTGDIAQTILEYGFEPILPTSINPTIFITQAIIIFSLSLIVGLYPVYKVFRMEIINITKQ